MKPVKRLLLSVCLLTAFAATVSAQVIPSQFDLLLDLDRDASTGCDVSTPDGPSAGVEVILTTVVEGTSVTSVGLRDCVQAQNLKSLSSSSRCVRAFTP